MVRQMRWAGLASVVLITSSLGLSAANIFRLQEGKPAIQSAGALAFGPQGVLFVGDTLSAKVFAIGTGDTAGDPASAKIDIADLDAKLATALHAEPGSVRVNDLAVNPLSGAAYLSCAVGQEARPALARIDGQGQVTEFPLQQVLHSQVTIPDAPENKVIGEGPRQRNLRDEAITDLAYVEGNLIVSGMSTAASPSTVRSFPFPFSENHHGASLEIYHGAHGRSENNAAIRTFVPFIIDGKPNLLAGFTCTPLVRVPLSDVQANDKVQGTTVAELGNRNRPLDMFVYTQKGVTYLLLSNSARGVMKISTDKIGEQQGISQPVGGGGTAGQSYETVESLKDVVQMDRLNETHALIMTQGAAGSRQLATIPLP